MSIKFTNEPPQGIRASLKRTYADVSQDTLDYSNHAAWPMLLFSVAFLHTVVQVRSSVANSRPTTPVLKQFFSAICACTYIYIFLVQCG